MSTSDLRVRFLTASVLVFVLAAGCWAAQCWPLGRWVLVALLGTGTLLAAREAAGLSAGLKGKTTFGLWLIFLLLPLLTGLLWNAAQIHQLLGLSALPVFLSVLLGVLISASFGFFVMAVGRQLVLDLGLRQLALAAASLQLVGCGGACLTLLPALGGQVWPLIWLFLIVCCNDIAAYFVGKSLGGPKLAPQVSPAKTISGAVGGLVAGVGVGFWAAHLLPGHITPWGILLMTLLLVGAAQSGDLLKSFMKRVNKRKDSGNLFPGHGGVLDRLDGVLAAAPLYVVLLAIFGASW